MTLSRLCKSVPNNKGLSVAWAVLSCVRTTDMRSFFDIQSDWTLMTYTMKIPGHMEFYTKHIIFYFLEFKARVLKMNTHSPWCTPRIILSLALHPRALSSSLHSTPPPSPPLVRLGTACFSGPSSCAGHGFQWRQRNIRMPGWLFSHLCVLMAPPPLPQMPSVRAQRPQGIRHVRNPQKVADPLCAPLNWVIREGGTSVLLKA